MSKHTPRIGNTYRVDKSCSGEYVKVGDRYEVVSIDALSVWLRGRDGMTTVKRRWFDLGHITLSQIVFIK